MLGGGVVGASEGAQGGAIDGEYEVGASDGAYVSSALVGAKLVGV